MSFDVTPPRRGGLDTPSFTPSKVLLSNLERKMNMLSPFGGEKLYHTDLEKSVIVSEWTFQKDGVDVGMKVRRFKIWSPVPNCREDRLAA